MEGEAEKWRRRREGGIEGEREGGRRHGKRVRRRGTEGRKEGRNGGRKGRREAGRKKFLPPRSGFQSGNKWSLCQEKQLSTVAKRKCWLNVVWVPGFGAAYRRD